MRELITWWHKGWWVNEELYLVLADYNEALENGNSIWSDEMLEQIWAIREGLA